MELFLENKFIMAVIAICALGATQEGSVAALRRTSTKHLIESLEGLGHSIVEFDNPRADVFVSFNHHGKALSIIKENIEINRRILIIQEPLVVQPANYSKRIQSKYGSIISMTPEAGNERLPWPQANWPEFNLDFTKRADGSIILVNANKSSFLPGSSYGLRRKVINAFVREGIPFDLAGSGWDRKGFSQFKQNLIGIAYAIINGYVPRISEFSFPTKNNKFLNKHGIVQSKYDLMAQKEFAVVIENSQTYISEKLFDAVIAGCIPLFCGPDLADFGIPHGVAVELPNRPQAFVEAYKTLTQSEKDLIRRRGQEWLSSPQTIQTWSQNPALERLASEISNQIS